MSEHSGPFTGDASGERLGRAGFAVTVTWRGVRSTMAEDLRIVAVLGAAGMAVVIPVAVATGDRAPLPVPVMLGLVYGGGLLLMLAGDLVSGAWALFRHAPTGVVLAMDDDGVFLARRPARWIGWDGVAEMGWRDVDEGPSRLLVRPKGEPGDPGADWPAVVWPSALPPSARDDLARALARHAPHVRLREDAGWWHRAASGQGRAANGDAPR